MCKCDWGFPFEDSQLNPQIRNKIKNWTESKIKKNFKILKLINNYNRLGFQPKALMSIHSIFSDLWKNSEQSIIQRHRSNGGRY